MLDIGKTIYFYQLKIWTSLYTNNYELVFQGFCSPPPLPLTVIRGQHARPWLHLPVHMYTCTIPPDSTAAPYFPWFPATWHVNQDKQKTLTSPSTSIFFIWQYHLFFFCRLVMYSLSFIIAAGFSALTPGSEK